MISNVYYITIIIFIPITQQPQQNRLTKTQPMAGLSSMNKYENGMGKSETEHWRSLFVKEHWYSNYGVVFWNWTKLLLFCCIYIYTDMNMYVYEVLTSVEIILWIKCNWYCCICNRIGSGTCKIHGMKIHAHSATTNIWNVSFGDLIFVTV